MYQPLVPCSACRRHVRATESACPFCSASLTSAGAKGTAREVAAATTRGMSRAAILALGAAIAVTACSSDDDPGTGNGTGQVGTGGTAGSAGAGGESGEGGTAGTAGTAGAGGDNGDAGSAAALYGIPPGGNGGAPDDGGNAPEYGAPPAGAGGAPDDPGSGNADYGAPPPNP